MTRGELVARARGLAARPLAAEPVSPAAGEELARARVAADLAILARWGRGDRVVRALALEEDRRSLRALVRGVAGGAAITQRRAGTIPTVSLPAPVLAALMLAPTQAALVALVATHGHPLAPALGPPGGPERDLFAIEVALARRLVALVGPAAARDRAYARYLGQLVDGDNAGAALVTAARGGDLAPADVLVEGGRRDLAAACRGPVERAREVVARAFAGTPVATAVYAAAPGAIEDAVLAWQLATVARARRAEPEGAAAVIHAVLRRRVEARAVRRAGWARVLGGGG